MTTNRRAQLTPIFQWLRKDSGGSERWDIDQGFRISSICSRCYTLRTENRSKIGFNPSFPKTCWFAVDELHFIWLIMFGESDFYSRMKMPVWLIRSQQAAVTPGQQTSARSSRQQFWEPIFLFWSSSARSKADIWVHAVRSAGWGFLDWTTYFE